MNSFGLTYGTGIHQFFDFLKNGKSSSIIMPPYNGTCSFSQTRTISGIPHKFSGHRFFYVNRLSGFSRQSTVEMCIGGVCNIVALTSGSSISCCALSYHFEPDTSCIILSLSPLRRITAHDFTTWISCIAGARFYFTHISHTGFPQAEFLISAIFSWFFYFSD